MNRLINIIKKYSLFVFWVYMALLILVIVLKFPTSLVSDSMKELLKGNGITRMDPQLIPFDTIIDYAGKVHSLDDWFIKNLAVNVIMFVPYGLLIPLQIKNKRHVALITIISGLLLSLVIEIFQYVTALGLCDIDDLILNVFGVILGYAIYALARTYRRKSNGI